MIDPTVLAYLAGVIDSDGHITIHRSRRGETLYHAARIGISGTRREPHDLAASLWGGKVGLYYPKNPRHRPQYQWSLTGAKAAEAIAAVQPFLRVKAEQAFLALELHEHVDAGRSEDPYPWFGPDYDPAAAREAMRQEVVTTLNQDRRAGRLLDGRTWDEMPQ
jgi:hypothetical protein